jgi:allophanate hydrolase subunit 2
MSILVRFSPSSITTEQYEESVRRLQESGGFPAEGMDYHCASSWTATSESARYGTRVSSGKPSGSA